MERLLVFGQLIGLGNAVDIGDFDLCGKQIRILLSAAKDHPIIFPGFQVDFRQKKGNFNVQILIFEPLFQKPLMDQINAFLRNGIQLFFCYIDDQTILITECEYHQVNDENGSQ